MTTIPSLIVLLKGQDFGDGWTKHVVPHKGPGIEYFHNKRLNVVTTKRLYNLQDRIEFTLDCQHERVRRRLLPEVEIFMDELAEVTHDSETYSLTDDGFSAVGRRGQYWAYLSNFPCHHKPQPHAKKEALLVLHLMTLQNLADSPEVPSTPFSFQEIERFKEFLSSSEHSEQVPSSETVIIAMILAGFYRRQLGRNVLNNLDTGKQQSWLRRLPRIIVIVSCCGMPPDYFRRFQLACNAYRRTLQVDQWRSFVEQVRKERAAANVMSGLLLASSVAFLAIPGLIDIAQFFIIASIGLALGSVIMGFNTKVDEKLSELEEIIIEHPEDKDKTLKNTAGAMEQHYSVLLLSVLCFFLSVLAFTAYSIYASVFVAKVFTVRYLFFVMATGTLIIMLVVTIIWNRRFMLTPIDCISRV